MHLDQFQFVISSKMAEPSNSLMPCEMIQRKSLFNHNTEIRKLSACAFCFVFMIIELVGCSLANSLVIATNVLCLWSDVTSYLISMAALLLIAERQSTDNRWSGHYRAEVLGAFASVIGTWFVAIFLGYLAIGRLLEGSIKIDSFIMMITATLGLLANLFILVIFRGMGDNSSSHVHSLATDPLHDVPGIDSFDSEAASGSDLVIQNLPAAPSNSTKVRATILHVIGDIFPSVGILVASIVIQYKPEWTFVDPACTLFFGLVVLITRFLITLDLTAVVMERSPKHSPFKRNKIEDQVLEIPGIVGLHRLRVWA